MAHDQREKVMPLLLVYDLGRYLQSTGFGRMGVNIFLKTMPDSPVVCTAILPAGGPEDARDVISRPRVQIICRDTDGPTVTNRAQAIWQKLHKNFLELERCHGRITGDHYPSVEYLDRNNRWTNSMNFSFLGVVTMR